jgi:hypothetical protein
MLLLGGRIRPAMSSAEAKNLEAISKAIDHHNSSCAFPAVAIDMNPFEIERLGWEEIRGLPVRPDASLGTGAFRIVCARDEGLPGEVEEVEAVSDQPLYVPTNAARSRVSSSMKP